MITITENLTTVTICYSIKQVRKILAERDKIVGKGLSTEDYTTAENKTSYFI
jgi:hypothetical protein